MTKMIQIRNVPEKTHRRLKSRSATEGMSMSEYLLQEIERLLERPTRRELLDRVALRTSIELQPSPAEVIRKERDHR